LAKKIANLWSIIDLIKPSRYLFSEEYKLYSEYIYYINLNTLVKKLLLDINGTTQQKFN
jgi:hypothetical protein